MSQRWQSNFRVVRPVLVIDKSLGVRHCWRSSFTLRRPSAVTFLQGRRWSVQTIRWRDRRIQKPNIGVSLLSSCFGSRRTGVRIPSPRRIASGCGEDLARPTRFECRRDHLPVTGRRTRQNLGQRSPKPFLTTTPCPNSTRLEHLLKRVQWERLPVHRCSPISPFPSAMEASAL